MIRILFRLAGAQFAIDFPSRGRSIVKSRDEPTRTDFCPPQQLLHRADGRHVETGDFALPAGGRMAACGGEMTAMPTSNTLC
ncbi:hypothetical protein [Quatrionicoccus australiensis]|uniref:hypothetical protein n=1 Tax=Quatrionicoccus australiensis TaxID=138118 RepID=UPI001CFB5CB0|nr:hypothetical protein [Quatrionicoccus australiensis]MCB4361772.1 hypothetical protein [Quatrionicoccus australiensis]